MTRVKSIILSVAVGVLFVAGSVVADTGRPVVGAIRWDAWTGGGVTEQVERTLGPKKYHNRLPWFAKVIDDKTVKIDGSPQSVMDREIEFAAQSGLDYWAFLVYAEDSSMSIALNQYLQSKKRSQIHFCLILHNTLHAKTDQWPAERDRSIALLKERGYQTVLGGRPLVYTFCGGGFPFGRFAEFLDGAKKQGLNPYCVYMGWNPTGDYTKVAKKGFDAVSAYAMGGSQPKFADLVKSVETTYWQNAAKSGTPYVPMVTTGWDKWPRKDNHVSWEKGHAYHRQNVFPSRGTPAEIATHLKNALDFVENHPKICKARAIIAYAWNEYDEGGWLAPTRGTDGKPDNSRLEAVRVVLGRPLVGVIRWDGYNHANGYLDVATIVATDRRPPTETALNSGVASWLPDCIEVKDGTATFTKLQVHELKSIWKKD